MMRFARIAFVVGVLGLASAASAACRSYGTQLECGIGSTWLVVGTQAAEEPRPTTSVAIRAWHDGIRIGDDEAARRGRFQIHLQDFGADGTACRRVGNETYCY